MNISNFFASHYLTMYGSHYQSSAPNLTLLEKQAVDKIACLKRKVSTSSASTTKITEVSQ